MAGQMVKDSIDIILADYAKTSDFSAVVMVTDMHEGDDGCKTIYAKYMGHANRADSITNTIDTRFQIASGTKILTSVAICQFVERKLISFDTKLSECLSDYDFPNYDAGITVHHLLTHSSGITSYFEEDENPDYAALWQDRPLYRMRSPRDYLPMFQDKKMKFQPGAGFEYNDGGFVLLGLIIEEVTGMNYIEYIQENIFAMCGMKDSGFFVADKLPERTALAYIVDKYYAGNFAGNCEGNDGDWRTNVFAVPPVGCSDGGSYTTAPDMVNFWDALLSGRLLKPETTQCMLQPHIDASCEGENVWYGYGVWLKKTGVEVTEYYVVGWDPGVAMISSVHVKEKVLITVLANINCNIMQIHKDVTGFVL